MKICKKKTRHRGKFGTSVAFISAKEKGRVKAIERHIKTKFNSEEIPSGKEVCRQQLFSLIDKIINVEVKNNEIEEFLPPIFDQFGGSHHLRPIMSGIRAYDQGKADVMYGYNNVMSHYQRIRRQVPEVDL